MRNVIITLMVTCALCLSSAAQSQINYDLFPGYGEKQGYPPSVHYRAWVINYRDNKYYRCVASYETNAPTTPSLTCTLDGAFDPPLLSGANVKTLQALGVPGAAPVPTRPCPAFSGKSTKRPDKYNSAFPYPGKIASRPKYRKG